MYWALGDGCAHLWAQEPAHPHITYDYPEDDLGEDCDDSEIGGVDTVDDHSTSRVSFFC